VSAGSGQSAAGGLQGRVLQLLGPLAHFCLNILEEQLLQDRPLPGVWAVKAGGLPVE